MAIQKTWKQTITPLINKHDAEMNKIFKAHKAEVKQKNLKTLKEINGLWNKKYKPKFNLLEKKTR